MSARVDQRNKAPSTQQSTQQQQATANGAGRRDDYDYAGYQMHGQPSMTQQVPYSPVVSSQAADSSYLNGYYAMNGLNYPQANFFDTNTWNASSSDAMSYLSNYGPEYMQFASGFDYAPTIGLTWPSYGSDYSSWSASQQVDPMKVDSQQQQQLNAIGQSYSSYPYQMTGSSASGVQRTVGSSAVGSSSDALPSALTVEPIDTSELEMGMAGVSMNGSADHSRDSPSDSSLHDPPASNVNNSSSKSTPPMPSKPKSWANVASQPAKPAPLKPAARPQARPSNPSSAHDASSWENGHSPARPQNSSQQARGAWSAPRSNRHANGTHAPANSGGGSRQSAGPLNPRSATSEPDPTLSKLKQTNDYNPKTFDLAAKNARFFVIKSYSEDDIHRAIKYGVWCSTEHGNKRLDAAFKERNGKGPIYLFYSVNGSGHFCGMAQMLSGVDYQTHAGVWTQDKWKGSMEIKWIYVKDVPNGQLRHIRLENNENKPVTNSRDTQEVPADKGKQVLKIIHTYKHNTSIFDDFGHYEKKEVEGSGDSSKKRSVVSNGSKN